MSILSLTRFRRRVGCNAEREPLKENGYEDNKLQGIDDHGCCFPDLSLDATPLGTAGQDRVGPFKGLGRKDAPCGVLSS